MARLITFLAIGFFIWLLWRGFARGREVRDESAKAPARDAAGEDMVACARCGVNMPRSEAREQSGAYYCRDNPRCHGA